MCIVPGTIIEQHPCDTCTSSCTSCRVKDLSPQKPFRLINRAYFISNNGLILGSYDKKNLWAEERLHLTSSTHTRHPVFDTPLGKVGLLICWDLAFPEAFRELISQGAKIIIIPAFWVSDDSSPQGLKRNPDYEQLFLQSTITSRCFENTAAVIFANAGGLPASETGKNNSFVGLSQISVPFIGPIGKLGTEEGILIGDLDMEIVGGG